jgi:hypothetical protein
MIYQANHHNHHLLNRINSVRVQLELFFMTGLCFSSRQPNFENQTKKIVSKRINTELDITEMEIAHLRKIEGRKRN